MDQLNKRKNDQETPWYPLLPIIPKIDLVPASTNSIHDGISSVDEV